MTKTDGRLKDEAQIYADQVNTAIAPLAKRAAELEEICGEMAEAIRAVEDYSDGCGCCSKLTVGKTKVIVDVLKKFDEVKKA